MGSSDHKRQADLTPPLGVRGGPCKVVERILQTVQNVRDREDLIQDVENNRDLTNAQAAIIYPKAEREKGPQPFDPLFLTSHSQYRMDLRGITVPEVKESVSRFRDDVQRAMARGDRKFLNDLQGNPKFKWVDQKARRNIVLGPRGDRLDVITVYPLDGSDPPAPSGGCSRGRQAGYRAPAGDLSGYSTYRSEKPAKGIYDSLGDTVEHPPGESPKGDRERARPESTDTKENLERHTPGNWSFNGPGPSSKEEGSKVPVRTVGQRGEEYGHPFKENITPRRTEANSEFPPYSDRQKKQQGEAKLYGQSYYERHRGKILQRAKNDYLHKKNSPTFKREKKNRNSVKFGWRFHRLPSGGSHSNAERSRKEREKKAQAPISFYHPNYGVGYVTEVVDQDVVIHQTDSLGGPELGVGTVPFFTFLRGAEFDSAQDIDALFAMADKGFGYEDRGPSRVAETFLRETYRPGDNMDPGDGVRDLGNPSQYSPTLTYPDTDRNQRAPGHILDVGEVDNNPGSAKVIPEGHDFVNKMAVRIAARMADILHGLDPEITRRAKSVHPTVHQADEDKKVYQYRVSGSDGKTYMVKMQGASADGTMEDVDIKVTCSCGFWQYQGPEYHARVGGYLLGSPRGTADRPTSKDPGGHNRVCKHVAACLEMLKRHGGR